MEKYPEMDTLDVLKEKNSKFKLPIPTNEL
jgi:hypothetical protein